MDWVDKPQDYKDLYGILQTLRGSHLNNFLRKTLKIGWVAFHLLTFQLRCLDFQSNQYKKLVPVLSRFCNWLLTGAIIGDGDRKSWDARGPMIWDNFSIFRTNCAILTSYIRARVVVSRVDVVTLRDQILRITSFSCGFFTVMAENKEPGLFYVLLCS